MKRKHRLAAWAGRAIILAGIAALVAACSGGGGSGPGSAPVASLAAGGNHAGQAGHPSALPSTAAQWNLDMIHFARCMRSHGVAMSDPHPQPGHPGSIVFTTPPQDAATSPAYAACTHFIQAIMQAKQAGGFAVLSPSRLAALTRYAECMRSRDIGMLDPTRSGELDLGNVPGITSDFGRYSPQFRTADTACRHLLPAGVQDDGAGP